MGGGPPADAPMVDTSEQVYISSLALLKMLKHGEFSERCCVCSGFSSKRVDEHLA